MSVLPTNEASISLALGPLTAPVLGRVIAMLAVRANLPVDRLNDAVLLGDTLAASARGAVPDGRLLVYIEARPATLRLRVGPLVADGAQRMRDAAEIPGAGNVLERLADGVDDEIAEDGEFLVLDVGAAA